MAIGAFTLARLTEARAEHVAAPGREAVPPAVPVGLRP
jgi:hypothetical protein